MGEVGLAGGVGERLAVEGVGGVGDAVGSVEFGKNERRLGLVERGLPRLAAHTRGGGDQCAQGGDALGGEAAGQLFALVVVDVGLADQRHGLGQQVVGGRHGVERGLECPQAAVAARRVVVEVDGEVIAGQGAVHPPARVVGRAYGIVVVVVDGAIAVVAKNELVVLGRRVISPSATR